MVANRPEFKFYDNYLTIPVKQPASYGSIWTINFPMPVNGPTDEQYIGNSFNARVIKFYISLGTGDFADDATTNPFSNTNLYLRFIALMEKDYSSNYTAPLTPPNPSELLEYYDLNLHYPTNGEAGPLFLSPFRKGIYGRFTVLGDKHVRWNLSTQRQKFLKLKFSFLRRTITHHNIDAPPQPGPGVGVFHPYFLVSCPGMQQSWTTASSSRTQLYN
jgi:hypothetical protein